MKLFGVANHSVDETIAEIEKHGCAKYSEIAVLPLTKKLKDTPPEGCKVLMVLTHADFKNNSKTLSKKAYSDIRVVFFSTAMRLHEYTGLIGLDFEPDPELPGYGFRLNRKLEIKKLAKDQPSIKIEKEHGHYLDNAIAQARKGSLLNAMMTFIYTLPSMHQTRIKLLFAYWFYQNRSEKELVNALKALPIESQVVEKILKKINKLLFTDVGKAYQAAFKEFAKTGHDQKKISSIAKSHQVSDYEMKYIISVLSEEKSGDIYKTGFEIARKKNKGK